MLGGDVRIETVLVPRDCTDGFGEAYWGRPEAYWGRPEAYLDPHVRASMPACSTLAPAEVDAGVNRLRAGLASGRWDERHGPSAPPGWPGHRPPPDHRLLRPPFP
jgi:hypothetical protein